MEALSMLGLAALVGIGGGAGAVLRASLSGYKNVLPWGTLIANTLAAASVGLLLGRAEFDARFGLFVIFGFAGGLSTFSTVAGEAFEYWHRGRIVQSLLTGALNIFIPLCALWITVNFS